MADVNGGIYLVKDNEPLRLANEDSGATDVGFLVGVDGGLDIQQEQDAVPMYFGQPLEVDGDVDCLADLGVLGDIDLTGNMGIGTLAVGAVRLLLAAGTTILAPLGFTSGALLTVPVDGRVEYDGSAYYATVGSDRQQVIRGELGGATISYATLPTGGGTWANGGDLTLTGGNVGIGVAPAQHLHLQKSGAGFTLRMDSQNATTGGATWAVHKSRGEAGAVVSGDQIVNWAANPHDGTAFITAARWRMTVDGAVSTGIVPVRFAFETMNAAGTVAERLRITSEGHLAINTASKCYLDGIAATGDTYLTESSANILDAVVGGFNGFRITSSVVELTTGLVNGTRGTVPRADVASGNTTSGAVITPRLQVLGGGAADSTLALLRATGTAGNSASLVFGKIGAGGDFTNVTLVTDATRLGSIVWAGTDGVDMGTQGARVEAMTEGTPAANRMPTKIAFWTAGGAVDNDIAVKMELGPAGNLGLVSGAKFYPDGVARTGDTWFAETSANVWDFTVGGVNSFRLTSTTGFFQAAPSSTFAGVNQHMEVHGIGNNAGAIFGRWSNDTSGVLNIYGKSRGALGTHTIVSAGDIIAQLSFRASDGVDGRTAAAAITVEVDAGSTPAANKIPGHILFSTAAGVANDDIVEVMRLTSTGRLLVGTTSDSRTIAGSSFSLKALVKSENVGSHWGWGNEMVTDTASRTGVFAFFRQRATGAAVASGDRLMQISAVGHDGTDYHEAASIRASVSAAVASDQIPTDLFFMVGNATGTLTERWRLLSSGDVAIGSGAKHLLDGTAGTGDTYLWETSSNIMELVSGGTAAMRVYSTTGVRMGTYTLGVSTGTVLSLEGPDSILMTQTNTSASGPTAGAALSLRSHDGAANVAGDRLGGFFFAGFNGTSVANRSAVAGFAAETWTTLAMGSYVSFLTTAIGTTTTSEKFRVGDTGALGMVSGQKFYPDGVAATGDTWHAETSANVWDFSVGGTTLLSMTATTAAFRQAATSGALVLTAESFTTSTSSFQEIASFLRRSTGDMVDGFGSSITFNIQDTAAVSNAIGAMGAVRAGADDTGHLRFRSAVAGTMGTRLAAGADGIGIVAASKVFYDGVALTGDTYRYESAANTLDDFAGGINALRLDGATALSDGDTSVLINRKKSGSSALKRIQFKDASLLAAGDDVMVLVA